MKYFFILSFLINSFFVKGQTSGIIEYDCIKNLGVNFHKVKTLSFNNNQSIFTEFELLKEESEVIQDDEDSNKMIVIIKSDTKKFIYNDLEKDTLFAQEIFFKLKPLTKERTPKIDWKLQDTIKNISKFKCQLAIGDFRGRTYHVWFTSEIPVRFGPWKLQGLPGLILEAKDDKNEIIYIAKKISINPIKFEKVDVKEAIELRDYIESKPKLLKEKEQSMSSKMPRNGTFRLNMPSRNLQTEIIFEWEENGLLD